MKTRFYTLPDWDFVGGETQNRVLTLQKEGGQKYDLPGATAHLAIVDFVNCHSAPVLAKELQITQDGDGLYCVVTIPLSPSETVNLSGKHIYQITVKDVNGNTSIPQKGIMHISYNIDRSFILEGVN